MYIVCRLTLVLSEARVAQGPNQSRGCILPDGIPISHVFVQVLYNNEAEGYRFPKLPQSLHGDILLNIYPPLLALYISTRTTLQRYQK